MDENRVINIKEYKNLNQAFIDAKDKIPNPKRTKLIQVRLTEFEKYTIERIAKSQGIGISKLIQDWIEKGCK